MNRRSVSVAAVLLACRARAALAAPSTVLSATGADRPRRPERGVAVRSGAALPDISNAEAVKRAGLEADSLVFNRASTGHYFEAVLNKMGLHAQALPNSTRYADGASVMEHVLHGQGREIGAHEGATERRSAGLAAASGQRLDAGGPCRGWHRPGTLTARARRVLCAATNIARSSPLAPHDALFRLCLPPRSISCGRAVLVVAACRGPGTSQRGTNS